MKNLDRHIEVLLLQHDCVIIPDFGGFVTSYIPAHYDEQQKLMYPPMRTVGFNSELRHNDSLLAQSYIEANDISYPEATKLIEKDVITMKRTLDEERKLTFHSIGTIFINNEGNIEFQPFEAGILTPSLYAMSAINAEKLTSTIKAENKQAETKPGMTLVTDLIAPELASNEVLDNENVDEENNKLTRPYIISLAAACIVSLFIMSTSLLYSTGATEGMNYSKFNLDFLNKITESQTEYIKPNDNQLVKDGHTTAVVTKKAVEKAPVKEELTPTASNAMVNNTIVTQEAETPSEYYCIVICSRISESGANEYASQLQARGINDVSIIGKGKSRKIIQGHYTTEQEAQQARRGMASTPEFADCWVMKHNVIK